MATVLDVGVAVWVEGCGRFGGSNPVVRDPYVHTKCSLFEHSIPPILMFILILSLLTHGSLILMNTRTQSLTLTYTVLSSHYQNMVNLIKPIYNVIDMLMYFSKNSSKLEMFSLKQI